MVLSVVPNLSEIDEAFADYEKFVHMVERCSAEADLYVQFASENFSITVPGPFKEQHIDLIEEWKFFEQHGVACKLWCEARMLSTDNASVDENYRMFIDERRQSGEIVENGVAGVLDTPKQSDDIPQVCLDYKNDDEQAGQWLIELIGQYCECFVETLSENEDAEEARNVEDARDQVHGVQSSIVQKLLNADFAVVLKKNRSNQQLFERIKYLREIIRLHSKGKETRLPPGAVAILPDGCDEEPGGYVFLKRADLTAGATCASSPSHRAARPASAGVHHINSLFRLP